ncbi:phage portal protein [Sphingomonas paucimobilis]|uniref:phage portal protein n=1 Tax=Sphingomonas paucimobilis TaxID=13689 RepID=UPI0015DC8938|nr:phage portal protein [Sphingomonas paucimobilis]BCI70001.1 phage portal protein [Sphingomonas paucimobilis]
MNGYRLSRRAAEAEIRTSAARNLPVEAKSVLSLTNGMQPGRQDGDNFRRNVVTTESMNDGGNSRNGAVGLSATWACVSFWAGNIASLPCTVQRKGPGGVPSEEAGHPLQWLLYDSPNSDQSAFDFWEFIVASIELRGNAYAEITRRGDGVIVALTPIAPDIVSVNRTRFGGLRYEWTDGTGAHTVDQADMLHIRGFGGGPLGGVSPLAACRQAFSSAVSVDRAATTMFANGVRSSGVMSVDKVLTKEQRDEAERLLQEKFVGAANAGRPMLLDAGLKWEQLSIDPHDAEMLESRRFSVEEVCRVFEVDPHLVGQTQGNTSLGSSIADQTNSVMKFKMRKRLKRIEGAATKQLLTRAERAAGLSIRFNVEAFLRADSVGRAEYYDKMKPFMTINQVRALEGWPPVEGGDVIYKQMQDVPITSPAQVPAGV